jgi:hypothetical protein
MFMGQRTIGDGDRSLNAPRVGLLQPPDPTLALPPSGSLHRVCSSDPVIMAVFPLSNCIIAQLSIIRSRCCPNHLLY